MKALKEILKRKMNFIHFNATQENYFKLELEFIDFIFETQELTEVVRKVILKNRIDREWLQTIFNSYLVSHPMFIEDDEEGLERIVLPKFWNDQLEHKLRLLKSFYELINEEKKKIDNNELVLNEKEIEKSVHSQFTTENFYNLKKLYSDIVQELDLAELRKNDPNKKVLNYIENFNEKEGILKFAGQEIVLSKSGKETDAVLLLKTLLKAKSGEWKHNDEILEDWGYGDEDTKDLPKNKIYFAGQKINNAVALKTKINDFIECNTAKARINSKYNKLLSDL